MWGPRVANRPVSFEAVIGTQASRNDVAIMMRNWAENPCRKG